MILVTGASGQLGQLVIESLLKKVAASQIVAGVRNPEKARGLAARGVVVRELDYDRPETIERALAGVERVLLVSSSEKIGQRAEQHRAVIEAARRAGVKLLAYTSVLRGDDGANMKLAADHRATERLLRASGVPYVLLRNGWYIENYTGNLAGALQAGVMLGSAGEGRVAPAARADFAEAAAAVLAGEGHEGKAYELAGDRSYTLAEIAAEVARQSGKPVAYRNLPAADYSAALAGFGVPAPFAEILADSDVAIERGELDDRSGTLSRLIGRPTTPLADVVAAALGAG